MADEVTEYRLVIRRGTPRRTITYSMGNGAKGHTRACEALERWTSVERHTTHEVWIEARKVAPWEPIKDLQLQLNP